MRPLHRFGPPVRYETAAMAALTWINCLATPPVAGARERAGWASADLSRGGGPDAVGQRQRQAPLRPDHQPVFRVERGDVRRPAPFDRALLVAERPRRESPTGLVIERAGAALAASEIEDAIAAPSTIASRSCRGRTSTGARRDAGRASESVAGSEIMPAPRASGDSPRACARRDIWR